MTRLALGAQRALRNSAVHGRGEFPAGAVGALVRSLLGRILARRARGAPGGAQPRKSTRRAQRALRAASVHVRGKAPASARHTLSAAALAGKVPAWAPSAPLCTLRGVLPLGARPRAARTERRSVAISPRSAAGAGPTTTAHRKMTERARGARSRTGGSKRTVLPSRAQEA